MRLLILVFLLLIFFGCSQGDTGRPMGFSKKVTAVSVSNHEGVDSFSLEKIRLKDGAEIYSPVSCENTGCSSLFYSVASDYNIDPTHLLEDTEGVSATPSSQALLQGSTLPKKSIGVSIDTPDVYGQPVSPTKLVVKNPDEGFEGIVKERKQSLVELNQSVKAPSVITKNENFSAVFQTILNKFKLSDRGSNKVFSIKNIENELGLTGNQEGFYQTQVSLKEANTVVTLSRDSIQYERTLVRAKQSDPAFSTNKGKVFDGMTERLTGLASDLDLNIKNLGESASYVLAFRTARAAQFTQIMQGKNTDGTYQYPQPLRREAEAQLSSKVPKALSADMGKQLATLPITLMMRKVSDQGFMALALGRPSKRLQLKAKSDSLGNIPVDQVFTHKVKGQGEQLTLNRAMFNEFSFQSRAEILSDGLPNSFSKRHKRQIKMADGSILLQYGLKKKNASPEEPIVWKTADEADTLLSNNLDQFAVYDVHADPRAMQGGSEALLKEWRALRVDSGLLKPPAEGFTHLKNTDWEAVGGFDNAKNIMKGQLLRREDNLSYAERANLDYAAFLLRKEAVDPSVNPELANVDLYGSEVTQFLGGSESILVRSQERLNTAGSIAPDIDLLSVGTKVQAGADDTVEVSSSIGRTNLVTRTMLDQTGTQAENMFVQKAIHHGAEVENYEFPQNLKDDYPIGVVSSDGSATRIPMSSGTHPHEFLFGYMRNHPGVDTSINPAYVVKNKSEFPKDLSRWPAAQKKRMKAYKQWVDEGVKKGDNKKAFFEKAKKEYEAFYREFPITYRGFYKPAINDHFWASKTALS